MKLVNFLNDLFKEDGFRLIDANKREYLIGKPVKKNPLILDLLDSSMHYKLLLLPDLYLGEVYMDGKVKIHNGTITEFLEMTLKNLGKHHPNNFSKVLNKILGTKYRNFCVPLDKFSIRETLPIIKNCNLSICNDSSFSHLSAALGVKTITLMADTPLIYGNYSSNMFPILPDGEETVGHNTLGKEKINSEKIFNKLIEITN